MKVSRDDVGGAGIQVKEAWEAGGTGSQERIPGGFAAREHRCVHRIYFASSETCMSPGLESPPGLVVSHEKQPALLTRGCLEAPSPLPSLPGCTASLRASLGWRQRAIPPLNQALG